jgi:hypothetical protein
MGRAFTIGQAAQHAPKKPTDPALAGPVRTWCPRTRSWCDRHTPSALAAGVPIGATHGATHVAAVPSLPALCRRSPEDQIHHWRSCTGDFKFFWGFKKNAGTACVRLPDWTRLRAARAWRSSARRRPSWTAAPAVQERAKGRRAGIGPWQSPCPRRHPQPDAAGRSNNACWRPTPAFRSRRPRPHARLLSLPPPGRAYI